MKALLCKQHGLPETLVVEETPDPVAGPGEVVVAMKAAGRQLPGCADHPEQVPVQAAAAVLAGRRTGGRGLCSRPRRGPVQGRGPGDRVLRTRRLRREGQGTGRAPCSAACRRRFRDRGRIHPHLRDLLACRSRTAARSAAGRNPAGARRRRRRRPGSHRDRQGARRAGHRGRLVGGKARRCAGTMARTPPSTIRTEDLRERIKALTDGKGPDVIYDPVGGQFAEPAFRSIAWRGRYLVVGFANGEIPRSCPSISPCSRARRSSACSGATMSRANRPISSRSWLPCSIWSLQSASAPTSRRAIRLNAAPRRLRT